MCLCAHPYSFPYLRNCGTHYAQSWLVVINPLMMPLTELMGGPHARIHMDTHFGLISSPFGVHHFQKLFADVNSLYIGTKCMLCDLIVHEPNLPPLPVHIGAGMLFLMLGLWCTRLFCFPGDIEPSLQFLTKKFLRTPRTALGCSESGSSLRLVGCQSCDSVQPSGPTCLPGSPELR